MFFFFNGKVFLLFREEVDLLARPHRFRRRLGKARERLLEATGEYALPHGGQLDEITGVRKQTRVRDLQFKVLRYVELDSIILLRPVLDRETSAGIIELFRGNMFGKLDGRQPFFRTSIRVAWERCIGCGLEHTDHVLSL